MGIDKKIRLLLADDQRLVRDGIASLLGLDEEIEVVGTAENGLEAAEMAMALKPDVCLLDIRMPIMDGISALQRIRREQSCPFVVMLTTFDMDQYVYDALQAGASGFLLKDVQPELLVSGIRSVHAGESLLAPSVTRRMIAAFLQRAPVTPVSTERFTRLTPREREILHLLARGLTNAEIADTLVVSETTVKTHVGRVLAKLELRDRVQAVIYAYEHGVAEPAPAQD